MRLLFAFALTLVVAAVLAQEYIPNQYVVMFKDNTPAAVRKYHLTNITSHSLWGSAENKIKSEWEIMYFSGYSAQIFSQDIVSFIASRIEVRVIEQDQVVHKSDVDACLESPTVQGTWGLARISSTNIQPLRSYVTPEEGGQGVKAYIIDTGILTTHTQFGGRAVEGRNFIPNESPVDLNGHGTHVAGTVGGNTYGIARKSTLVAVKCLDRNGSGTLAGVIDAVNWVASERRRESNVPCTANLSLGASYSLAVNNACDALVEAGCFVAVAAGNSNRDACAYSPASAPRCVSAAASDSSDIRAYFSNFGKCTDLFAPGVNVLSAYIGSTTASATLSGTSMAAPHVCGVATNYLSLYPSATPQQVETWMITRGVKGTITDDAGSPNVLVHQGCY